MTHPDTTYAQFLYNADGTLAWKADEMHPGAATDSNQRTSYTYDDYKRVLTVTTPRRSPGDGTARTTNYSYDNPNTSDHNTHTDSKPRRITSPSGRIVTVTSVDANLRNNSVSLGTGAETATTTYTYDAVGNLKTIKDPRGQASGLYTENFYDARNRLTDMNDPIAADRNSNGHTISYTYDPSGNKTTERRADNKITTYDSYDAMNRLTHKTEPRDGNSADNIVMSWSWSPSGKLLSMTDSRQKTYSYSYDLLNRKLTNVYPPANGFSSARQESYSYNSAAQLETYTNRNGNMQAFQYDIRNRLQSFNWDNGAGITPSQTFTYDAASRPLQIWNWDATINFTYYDDNLLKTQEEFTPDYGDNLSRTNNYSYDADGNRSAFLYPSGSNFVYTYTTRNQLKDITLPGYGTLITYDYDLSGNRSRRALIQGTVTDYAPADALNRSAWVRHTFTGGQTEQYDYGFDKMSRLTYEQRSNPTGTLADG